MAEFEAVFGDSDKAKTSANKLRRLQQGTRLAIVYASEFKHSYDILGARMLWKPKEARILKNF